MDNIREKLVELFDLAARVCNKTNCDECRYFTEPSCTDQLAVDILIHNGVTVQEWISVSEPPKEWRRDNGEMINYLVYVPEFGVDIGNYGEPAKCWLCMGLPCKPTHWAHLPTPPKQEG